MKNIVMIGDSFGVPNKYLTEIEMHTEFLLKKLKKNGIKKYNVFNLCVNGAPNNEHAASLRIFILNNPLIKIDFVIWFHNAAMGVIKPPTAEHKLTEYITEQLHLSYKEIRNVATLSGAKWIVIGGSSPIPSIYYQYQFHSYLIPDWRAKILGERLPEVFGAGVAINKPIVNNELNLESHEIKVETIKRFAHIQILMSKAKHLFPDGCHPGPGPHIKLTQELDNYMTSVP